MVRHKYSLENGGEKRLVITRQSISSIQKKLLNVLHRRQVTPIEFEGTQPDFNICKVVEREIRTDLEPQTITKVVRKGFQIDKKILLPIQIITSKLE